MAGVFRALSRRFFVVVLGAIASLALVLFAAGVGEAKPVMASWYGPGFEGRTTSSGEKFNPQDYTAASRTLPFGTKLVVTYKGRSVVVRVNDRGPFSEADLDLSQAAAQYIGLTGVGVDTVDVVTADPSTPTGPYKANASALMNGEKTQNRPELTTPETTQNAARTTPQGVIPRAEEAGPGTEKTGANGLGKSQGSNQPGEETTAAEEQRNQQPATEAPDITSRPSTAPPPPAPVTPAPPPPQKILVAPPPELVTPGSTVERRLELAAHPEAAEQSPQYADPAPSGTTETTTTTTKSDGSSGRRLAGITELPRTGGAPIVGLSLGGFLLGLGLFLRRMVR